MKVLSLFDGISCGKVALERAGIQIEEYVAFEIDKYAIKISKKNHPDIIQRGDVTKADFSEFEGFDIVIGGSPCQGFSFAGKQLNFEDPRSKLFFEFVRAVEQVKPKYFLLENVKMKKEFENIISEYLGVEPIEINSGLVSAQSRKRLYWTNIPGVTLPEDKGIMLKDVVHENEEQKPEGLGKYIVPFDKSLQILDKEVQKGKIGYFRKDSQANRVYSIHGKAVTLCGEAGGGAAKMGQYLFGCLTPDRIEKRQNGQRFNEGNKFYTLTAQDRHGVLIDGYIRKLTPVECERLQTLPDNYTDAPGVTDAQRYKCLGNGWTVDVIAHILKGLKTGNGQEKDQAVRDWKAAENAINKSLEDFSNLGPAGMFGVKILTPLRVRYDKGERTADLFNAIVEATR
ncbi:DNA (cytosine-5-)-methyltransferase [[Clostridium] scindens]|uniref:DNA (cytosine-5-)-methyltransferase n=1 Tax=Clostridium scindens (strain ATCC 35704 / DSM 5676 / VPI 13733 / 19) TaxID=411468 RepID=A0A494WPF7_CLOS5|nr:DNA (cytosine-5-)-methyltransferase [[Clostridium] scindens]QBF75557.1 Modification methylase HhaI [[Clostridium] scindens ATCC 35704]QRO38674.1 DNA (cytosine-5-)-methyltransferase [[Clostridium] scindens]